MAMAQNGGKVTILRITAPSQKRPAPAATTTAMRRSSTVPGTGPETGRSRCRPRAIAFRPTPRSSAARRTRCCPSPQPGSAPRHAASTSPVRHSGTSTTIASATESTVLPRPATSPAAHGQVARCEWPPPSDDVDHPAEGLRRGVREPAAEPQQDTDSHAAEDQRDLLHQPTREKKRLDGAPVSIRRVVVHQMPGALDA